MANKYGIDVVQNVFRAVVQTVETAKSIDNSEDNGVGKYFAYLNVIPAFVMAGQGIAKLPNQLSDIEPEEFETLKAEFGSYINNPLYVNLFGHVAGMVNTIAELTEKPATESEEIDA